MNAFHVICKIHYLVHIKKALIALYNDVEFSCEHLATFQLKILNHIYHVMYYLLGCVKMTLFSNFNGPCVFSHYLYIYKTPCKVSGLKIEFSRSPQLTLFYYVNLEGKNISKIKMQIFVKKSIAI